MAAETHRRPATTNVYCETSMREDCDTGMSATQGCNDDQQVVDSFKEALRQRVGTDRYEMWFSGGVEFSFARQDPSRTNLSEQTSSAGGIMRLRVGGQFALERIRSKLLPALRGAAMQACGDATEVQLELDMPSARQADLPLPDAAADSAAVHSTAAGTGGPMSGRQRSATLSAAAGNARCRQQAKPPNPARQRQSSGAVQLELPDLSSDGCRKAPDVAVGGTAASQPNQRKPTAMTRANFIVGPCNQLAHMAMTMVCQNPALANPLFVCGPTGSGKSHLLAAIADELRRRHRLRRVVLLTAEQFTNDFISSVGSSGLPAFRRRYREVDALLIDGVEFVGEKKATLRELLYTVESLAGSGCPLVASGTQPPAEIQGLTSELAGRLSAGLVCPLQPLDRITRETMLMRELTERCPQSVPKTLVDQINATLAGDGRLVRGVANLVHTLQRMFGRSPTMDELRQFGGDLLRASVPVTTLAGIEAAVCQAFHLPLDTLRSGSQSRAVTEPRMLAMYLSRQLTASAYREIAVHFGGRSHSTAIAAEKNVKQWLAGEKLIGRGHQAVSASEAVDRVERLLRSG